VVRSPLTGVADEPYARGRRRPGPRDRYGRPPRASSRRINDPPCIEDM